MEAVGLGGSTASRNLAASFAQVGQEGFIFLGNAGHRGQQAVFVDAALPEQDLGSVLDGEERQQDVGGG